MSFVITPRVSEKAYAQAGNLNTYVFVVPLSANKIEVKKAVEKEFTV
jgi:ribosomal protein L23